MFHPEVSAVRAVDRLREGSARLVKITKANNFHSSKSFEKSLGTHVHVLIYLQTKRCSHVT